MTLTDGRHQAIWVDQFRRELAALQAEDELGRASVSVSDRDHQSLVIECLAVLKPRPHDVYHGKGRLYRVDESGSAPDLIPVTAAMMAVILAQNIKLYRRPKGRHRTFPEPVKAFPRAVPKLLVDQGEAVLSGFFPSLDEIPSDILAAVPVVRALIWLRDQVGGREWNGSYRSLFESLAPYQAAHRPGRWPGSDSALSRLLGPMAGAMRKVGIHLIDLIRDKRGSRLLITWDQPASIADRGGAGDVGILQARTEPCKSADMTPVPAI